MSQAGRTDIMYHSHESDLEYHGDLRVDLPDPDPDAGSVFAGILELPWDNAIRLGGCGREIVELCQGGHSRNDVVRLMCLKYPATPQNEMERACDRFLTEVEALGALTRAPRSGRGAAAAIGLPFTQAGSGQVANGYATLATAPNLPDANLKKPSSSSQVDVGRALARGSFPAHIAQDEPPPVAWPPVARQDEPRQDKSPEELNQRIADEQARCDELSYEVAELREALRAASEDAHTAHLKSHGMLGQLAEASLALHKSSTSPSSAGSPPKTVEPVTGPR